MSTRRNFLKTLSGMALLTVVPRHVLGGPKHVAPSDLLTKGIIGVGGIGKSSYHFTSTKECRLVAVCDVDSKHLQSALDLGKKRFNETLQSYRDFRRLIADPNVDIVHIATPPHWHGIMAVEAAKAGKDIWCEKPMTRTIGEGKRVVEAVKRNNRIFRLNTWFRFTDTFYGLGPTVEPSPGNSSGWARRTSSRRGFRRISTTTCGSARPPTSLTTNTVCTRLSAVTGTTTAAA